MPDHPFPTGDTNPFKIPSRSDTASPGSPLLESSKITLAVVFGTFVVILLILAVIIPRVVHISDEDEANSKTKLRLKSLDSLPAPQAFNAWVSTERDKHLDYDDFDTRVCVICLDEIKLKDLVRGLSCGHVYHKTCLDGWWARFHDFCPLCHRPIAPLKWPKSKHCPPAQRTANTDSSSNV